MHNAHMSKRKRQALLFFTYGFMAFATIVITAICLLLVLGYRFDAKDKRIEQGGLLQFRSTPAGAKITLDGTDISQVTPSKSEVSAGSHTVVMRRDGYHPWQKTVRVDAGMLRWLDYARLVPVSIVTRSVAPADTVTAALASPSREYIAALTSATPTVVTIYDVRDPAKIVARKVTIPTQFLTAQEGAASTLQLVEWDLGSRYLIVTHTSGTTQDYIRIDRNASDGAVRNLSREFNLPFRDMHFSGTSGAIYYALTGTDIRRVDLGAKAVSQPLVGAVESYVLYGDATIAYVARSATQKIAGVYKNDKATTVHTLSLTEPVWVDITTYFYHEYLAVGSRTHVDIIRDPTTKKASQISYATLSLPYEIGWVSFSGNGRMLAAGNGRAFQSYDLETNERHIIHADETGSDTIPAWLDDYYLIDNPSGTLRMYEFDGTNSHSITTSERNLPVLLSSNQQYLYSFGRDKDKLVLQSSRMVLN